MLAIIKDGGYMSSYYCILENSHNSFEFLRKAKISTMRGKERRKEKELNQEREEKEQSLCFQF